MTEKEREGGSCFVALETLTGHYVHKNGASVVENTEAYSSKY